MIYFVGFTLSVPISSYCLYKSLKYSLDFTDPFDLGWFFIWVLFFSILWPLVLVLLSPFILAWLCIRIYNVCKN